MTREARLHGHPHCIAANPSESTDIRGWDYTQVGLPIDIPSHAVRLVVLALSSLALIFTVLEVAGT